MNNVLYYRSPLGVIRLAAKDGALVSAAFVDRPGADSPCPVLSEAKAWLDRYFEGRDPGPIPDCDLQGTPFQKAVWDALLSIPYGKTTSYGKFAKRMGLSPRHARAIGSAVGKNPLALFYPCHRVVGADGDLTGYAFGVERKKALLETEKRSI